MTDLSSKHQKPRIALACPSFSGGGAERVMVTLANKFVEWGYPVDFIVGVDKGPYRGMLNGSVDKIVLTDEGLGRVRRKIQAFNYFRRYFGATETQVMLVTIKELNVLALFSKIFSRSKLKIFVREADTLDRIFVDGGIKNKVLYQLMRFFYPKSEGVIANCKITKKDLVEKRVSSSSSISVIYNPLDKIEPNKYSDHWRKDTQKIVACGRLHSKKNFPDLLRVIPLLIKRYGNVSLKILGEGPERENLQELIYSLKLEKHVELVGFVNNPYDYYASADVFVQTSLWEGFGYVLVEAMACGTPVVAYDSKGAMREILENGKYGKLTPVGDLPALAEAIAEQIEQRPAPDSLKKAVERFHVDVIARQYLKALGVSHA